MMGPAPSRRGTSRSGASRSGTSRGARGWSLARPAALKADAERSNTGRTRQPAFPGASRTIMSIIRNLSIGNKLAAAFGAVCAIFVVAIVVTLSLSSSAQRAWQNAMSWDSSIDASAEQIRGTQLQMASQALYTATGERRYRADWNRGVAIAENGAKRIERLGDPELRKISGDATAADRKHDASVHRHLFPAMDRGDHAAAVA